MVLIIKYRVFFFFTKTLAEGFFLGFLLTPYKNSLLIIK